MKRTSVFLLLGIICTVSVSTAEELNPFLISEAAPTETKVSSMKPKLPKKTRPTRVISKVKPNFENSREGSVTDTEAVRQFETFSKAAPKLSEEVKKLVEVRSTETSRLITQLNEAEKARTELEAMTKKLRISEKTTKADLEMTTAALKDATEQIKLLRQVLNSSPAWYDGQTKEVVDSKFGTIQVKTSKLGTSIRIPSDKTPLADKLFAKIFIERERRQEYTYYLVPSAAVKFRETISK